MRAFDKLKEYFEQKYLDTKDSCGDWIRQDAIDICLDFAKIDNVVEDMLNYAEKNPDADFYEFAKFLKGGLHGITQEELLADDE